MQLGSLARVPISARRGTAKPKRVVQSHTSCTPLQEFIWTTPEYFVEYRVLAQFIVQRCARSIALAQVQSSLQVPPWFPPSHQDVRLRPHPAVGRCHIACGRFAAHHRRRLDLVGRGGAYCRHLVAAYREWLCSRGDLGPCQPMPALLSVRVYRPALCRRSNMLEVVPKNARSASYASPTKMAM